MQAAFAGSPYTRSGWRRLKCDLPANTYLTCYRYPLPDPLRVVK